MTRIKRKITFGGIFACCTLLSLGAAAVFGKHTQNGAVPVSVSYKEEKPVIVLDAGHGEST